MIFETVGQHGHEQVVYCSNREVGLKAIIAVHSTVLGPALGGLRMWPYATEQEALNDVLRLSKGMTYKAAVAGLNLGGGKAVMIGDNRTTNREMLFRAHGRFVDSLGGRYITAEDVGTSVEDMDFVHMETKHVTGIGSKSGDPSSVTAHGVFRAIEASAKERWGSDSLEGKRVALQGCGNVGFHLARELFAAGATLVVTDIDEFRIKRVVDATHADVVEPEAIYGQKADIFAPCALGGIINDATLPQLRVEIVAGAANNQLLEPRHGDELAEKGILYAPDYVANAGGVINVYSELTGWTRDRALRKADEIYETVLSVFGIATRDGIPTYLAADRVAEQRISAVRAMVRQWPQYPNKES